ncbi:MAG: TonB family protein [Candidatus Sulfotelmatobacter sp.]
MSDLKTIVPRPGRRAMPQPRPPAPPPHHDRRQRELMVGSLCLLLLALSIVLWRNRDFWFGDSPDQANTGQPVENTPVATAPPTLESAPAATLAPAIKPAHKALRTSSNPAPANASTPTSTADASTTPPPVVMNSRTALPPLEVEVVAGDSHRVLRPGSNSVRVDLQPGSSPETTTEAPITDTPTAATVTSNAAERVQMSADASAVVTSPVKPNYPLLARQMKVQGSVILQALIGKDGIIQNLRVVSGPHILASAAQDAVRQWHFKPHLEGDEAVETQAKITVNFTISTN